MLSPDLSRRLARAVNIGSVNFETRDALVTMAQSLPQMATFGDIPKSWQDWVLEQEKKEGITNA